MSNADAMAYATTSVGDKIDHVIGLIHWVREKFVQPMIESQVEYHEPDDGAPHFVDRWEQIDLELVEEEKHLRELDVKIQRAIAASDVGFEEET